MPTPRLSYVIKFVGDMDAGVAFYRDKVGLALKFQSPRWSEFATGDTTLALHPASDKNPIGTVELGLSVEDLNEFHRQLSERGVNFTMPPKQQEFGSPLAQFVDADGTKVSVSTTRESKKS